MRLCKTFAAVAALTVCALSLSSAPAAAYQDEIHPSLERFGGYKPTYFIAGHPNTKIQVSFKVQLVEAVPLYFAYTQLMMWELFNSNPHFSDLNYNPEVFYRFPVGDAPESWLDAGPIEHESNGMGGARERSWNRTYARYQWVSRPGSSQILWNVKAWVPYGYNASNKDIAKYRGLGELNVTLSQFLGENWERGDLTLRLYLGGASYLNPME